MMPMPKLFSVKGDRDINGLGWRNVLAGRDLWQGIEIEGLG
jgi:hypothetical protein